MRKTRGSLLMAGSVASINIPPPGKHPRPRSSLEWRQAKVAQLIGETFALDPDFAGVRLA